ncbi:hypothetical protein MMC22_006837 [Lobaria immixta]|nr:hypothetical protein [Lobaria immixta]
MALAPIFKKAYWSLAAAGGLYFVFLTLLLNESIQRHVIYAHKLHTAWWQDPKRPEQCGYLKNQVRPFNISTLDGETLFAWHVLPLALYAKHENLLLDEPTDFSVDIADTAAFKLLSRDPESRLVINFHGNAGTVAQGWRTDTYRAIASGASDKIHVVTVDYRGFGYSTGSPTEAGLITDGVAAVDWALRVAKIPPERILILGQSLGTAVATAVVEHFTIQRGVEFAGLILVAAFSDLPTVTMTYAIGGVIPLLSPLRPYPSLQKFLARRILDTWETSTRLANVVRKSRNIDLTLIHARNDFDISWKHSDSLFYSAANATSEHGLSFKQIDGVKTYQSLGDAGWVNTWTAAGKRNEDTKKIRQEILASGGKYMVLLSF